MDDFSSLVGTLDRIEAAGLELVESVLAIQDSCDRYVAADWRTVTEGLAAHLDDPDHDAMREFRDRERRAHLEYGRRYLGWGVFVTQLREHTSGG